MTTADWYASGSAGAGLIACGIWIRRTRRGLIDEDTASWLIWSMAYTSLLVASIARGRTPVASLALNAVEVASTLIICCMTVRHGRWSLGTWPSLLLIAADVAAVAAWAVTRNPTWAIVIMLAVIASGAVPTVVKARRQPASEPASAWTWYAIGGLIAAAGVQPGDPYIAYGYPGLTIAMSLAVVTAILRGTLATVQDGHQANCNKIVRSDGALLHHQPVQNRRGASL